MLASDNHLSTPPSSPRQSEWSLRETIIPFQFSLWSWISKKRYGGINAAYAPLSTEQMLRTPPPSPRSAQAAGGYGHWLCSRSFMFHPLSWFRSQWQRNRIFRIYVALGLSVVFIAFSQFAVIWIFGPQFPSTASPGDEAELLSQTPVAFQFNSSDDRWYAGGCMPFETRLSNGPGPKSAGRYKLPYVRPPPSCRTFNLSSLETIIDKMRTTIHDPDLFRLFENTYPNTLDTMIKWHGYANKTNETTMEDTMTDEELTYIITGDIDAMWLRDSAAQMQSYSNLLVADIDTTGYNNETTLARLWRGLINLQARYVLTSPYCHSFQPPRESGIPPTRNPAHSQNHPFPGYDRELVFDCKWELDSLASFLQISATYFEKTADVAFFSHHSWLDAVEAAVNAAAAMRLGMYDEEGHVLNSAYTFTGWTDRGTETLNNFGLGNPSRANGMVRTSFRPSDDATVFQFLVPANMMWAASLERASNIMDLLSRQVLGTRFTQQTRAENLTTVMRDFATGIREGIASDAIVQHRVFGDIFAYEVDGYGSVNLMDDANIPSLLSIPLLGFLDGNTQVTNERQDGKEGEERRATVGHAANHGAEAEIAGSHEALKHQPLRDYADIYANTRRFVLSKANPYFAWGEPGGFAAVGGPHMGPGKAWPMASIVTALTMYRYVDDNDTNTDKRDRVVSRQLSMLLNSTWGTGVMHESIDTWSPQIWTRPWFGWANGLFGELILAIAEDDKKRSEDERLLNRSWQ